jgi:hypothetical protein
VIAPEPPVSLTEPWPEPADLWYSSVPLMTATATVTAAAAATATANVKMIAIVNGLLGRRGAPFVPVNDVICS